MHIILSILSYLDVVQTHNSRDVFGSIVGPRLLGAGGQPLDELGGEGGVEDVEDVVEAGVDDLVVVGEAVELVGPQVEEHAVPGLQGVRVGVSVAASTLV